MTSVQASLKAITDVLQLLSLREAQGILVNSRDRLEIQTGSGPVVLEFQEVA